jgi:hypothetical protein
MEFLVQTEQKLAVEISGNYQHLLEQQRAHEVSCDSSLWNNKRKSRPLQDTVECHVGKAKCALPARMQYHFHLLS